MAMHVRGLNPHFTSKSTFSKERHCDCLYLTYKAIFPNLDACILGLLDETVILILTKRLENFDQIFGKIAHGSDA